MRPAAINKIFSLAEKDPRIFLLTGDAGYGLMDKFQQQFPGQFRNMGIAEQNMISFGAGLSMTGFRVFAYNIIPFLLYRPYEQVRIDICYQRLPVILIGTGTGITYSSQGMAHYSVEDIALARTLPNLTVFSPADPRETEKSVEFAYTSQTPVYIRVSKSGEPVLHSKPIMNIQEPLVMQEGEDVAVLFHGTIGQDVMVAVSMTSRKPLVLSIPMVQPLNVGSLAAALKNFRTVIVVEEHFVHGGLGTIIGEWKLQADLPFKLKFLGIKNEFIHAIKDNKGMKRHFGIDPDSIKSVLENEFENA